MRVNDLLVSMVACLVAQIEDDGLVAPCWAGVVPGGNVVADFMPECFDPEDPAAMDGMAWVRLSSAYPAFQPGIIVENPAESAIAGLGYDIEIGILRSMPIPQEGVDPDTSGAVALSQMQDMLAIRKSVLCCSHLERADYILNQYTPVGPMGGVVGGAFTVMVHQP